MTFNEDGSGILTPPTWLLETQQMTADTPAPVPIVDLPPVADLDTAAMGCDRAALAGLVTRLFAHWQLDSADQAAMIGLPGNEGSTLGRFQAGDYSDVAGELRVRIGHLLGIHQSLRQLFPTNPQLAYGWMTSANAAFSGRTPADLVKELGVGGLVVVRLYLSRAIGP